MRLGILWAVTFTSIAAASSMNVPEKNPFRSKELSVLNQAAKSPTALKIVFSGNVTGMRESCGCALSPKGGLERRYNYLKNESLLETSQADILKLDFGNLLFKTPQYEKGGEKESLANAQAMIAGTNLFNLNAVNFGVMDRTLSAEKLAPLMASAQFPWVSTNITAPEKFGAKIQRSVSVKLNNSEVRILGLSSLDEKLKEQGWNFETPADALKKELAKIPTNVLPIVLSDVEMAELIPLAQQVSRPILFLGSRETGGWDRPIEVGQALLVHLRQQGQDWGVLKFSADLSSKKGWFNPSDAEILARRWDDLVTEALTIRSLASSNQKMLEIDLLESKIKELAQLAPQSSDIAFSFETTEMNAAFDGKNVATKFMK